MCRGRAVSFDETRVGDSLNIQHVVADLGRPAIIKMPGNPGDRAIMKILIIDSDKMMRDVLVKALASAMVFSPSEADDIESGASMAVSLLPDFVLVDMDAIADDPAAGVARLKAASPSAGIAVISGMGVDENAVRAALAAGASNLSKPFRMEQLKLIVGIDGSSPSASGAREGVSPSGRKNILPGAVALAVSAGLIFAALEILSPSALPPASFDVESKNISYLACSGGRLYVTDWLEQGVYIYSIPKSAAEKNLLPAGVYKKNDFQPTAASAFGPELWVADSLQGMFVRYKIAADGNSILPDKTFRPPSTSPSGIFAEKEAVWSYDFNTRKLYKHAAADMSVAAVYDLPIETPCGMARLSGLFYVGDTRTGRIVALNPRDMTVALVAEPREYAGGKEKMVGLCADGANIWTASESGRIFRHDPSRLSGELK